MFGSEAPVSPGCHTTFLCRCLCTYPSLAAPSRVSKASYLTTRSTDRCPKLLSATLLTGSFVNYHIPTGKAIPKC